MPSSLARATLGLAILAASCSVDNVYFTPEGDGGGVDGSLVDANPDALALVVSTDTLPVDEAAQSTFTVVLSQVPTGSVLVTVATSDGDAAGVTPTALLFEIGNWDTPQTVTVSGIEDADTVDDTATILLSSAMAGNASVAIDVLDNDELLIVASPSLLEVGESSSSTLDVHLSAQPPGDVVVTITSMDPAIATATPATLTFGVADWDLDQQVLVTALDDADTVDGTTVVTASSTGLADLPVPIDVIDDDVLGIAPSTTNLGTLIEGGSSGFDVALTQQPGGNVTVAVTAADTGVATVTPATLTFTPTDWNTPQAVAVVLPHDDDVADEATTISLAATGLTTRTVSAAVDDDDSQTIIAAPVPLAVDEGTTGALGVRLAFVPAADVTVQVSSLNTAVATVAPATLTFTPANYATAQNVTVTTLQDQDAASGFTSIRLESLAEALSTDVPVNVTDDDQLLIEVDMATVDVAENGVATFRARLTAMPVTNVLVAVTSGDPSAAAVDPATLTFSTANWNNYQTVTVSGVADVDVAAEVLNVTLAASGLPARTVAINVTDDDMQTIVVSAATLNIVEGQTGTVGVHLSHQPAGNVSVSVVSGTPAAATVAPATLTFNATNYATTQNVTVSGVDDADVADGASTVSLTATGATGASVAVTVDDPDVLGLEVDLATLTIGEATSGVVRVRLTAQPAASTTVTVTSSDTTAATVAPSPLTFTTANWNTYQNVTVSGVDDADATNDSVTVTVASTGLTSQLVSVTVTDNEVLGIQTSAGSVALIEGGSQTFQARLTAAPAGPVTVAVASGDSGAASVSPATLAFDATNWNVNQTVTVGGVADLDLADESVTINLTATGVQPASVTASVDDDDAQAVVVTTTTVNVDETTSTTLGVSLAFQPAGTVTVAATPANSSVATASPATLSFTPADYATPKTLTITGADDPDAVDGSTSISLTAPGATGASVTVNVNDNDVLGIGTDVAMVTVTEVGPGTADISVRLTAQPPASTTVNVVSNDTGAATVAAVSGTLPLTFTTANWNVNQTIRVTAVPDADAANESLSLTLSATGLPNKIVGVGVTDDEVLAIETSVLSVAVGEGGTATFGVRLTAQPLASTTVSVASSDTSAATVSPATLSFTTANYGAYQTVTVTGVQDVDLVGESVTLTMSATGLADRTVTATTSDNDTQVVVATQSTLQVNEGNTGTITVALGFQPSANLTVNVASANTAIATVSVATLTFTPANWNVTQNVTVTGVVDDTEFAHESTTVSFTATGATGDSTSITVEDDDLIQVDDTSHSICPFDTAVWQVRLFGPPLGASLVVSQNTTSPRIAVAPASHTFTAANYGTYVFSTADSLENAASTNSVTLSAPGQTSRTVSVTVLSPSAPACQL